MKRVVIINLEDWIVVYIDGESVYQAHSLPPMKLLKLAEVYEFESNDIWDAWVGDDDNDYADTHGRLPDNYNELVNKEDYEN
jgi:hypothetical protein